jgi:hypothetical protein
VLTSNDPMNCGSCGHACATGQVCITGTCMTASTCPGGMPLCNGFCPNYDNDPHNCGGCGVVCPAATPLCRSAHCIAGP